MWSIPVAPVTLPVYSVEHADALENKGGSARLESRIHIEYDVDAGQLLAAADLWVPIVRETITERADTISLVHLLHMALQRQITKQKDKVMLRIDIVLS